MKENEDPRHNIGDLPPTVKARLFDLHQENLEKVVETNVIRSTYPEAVLRSKNIEHPFNIAGNQPLSSARDPRRKRLLGRTPFAPVAESHNQCCTRIENKPKHAEINQSNAGLNQSSDRSKILFGRNDITPAYAYKNAESGLLEIRSIVPPRPEAIDAEEETVQDEVNADSFLITENPSIPALYPIALNGGGIGIYLDPRDFATGRMGALSHNQGDPARIATRSFISFPWNMGNGRYSDRKIRKRHAGVSHDIADRSLDKESLRDEEMGREHSAEKNNRDQDLRVPMNEDSSFSPWKVWERVHNYMVDVTERNHGIPTKLNFQDIENTRGGKFVPAFSASARRKRIRLSTLYNEDNYDFVLVFKPKAVYKFWADLLDFRSEYGLENSDDEDDYAQDDEDENVAIAKHSGIVSSNISVDAKPYPSSNAESTPLDVTKKRRRGEISSEKKTKSASPSRKLKLGIESCREQDGASSCGKLRTVVRQSSLFEKALAAISPPRNSISLVNSSFQTVDAKSQTIKNPTTLDGFHASCKGNSSPAIRRKWGGRLSHAVTSNNSTHFRQSVQRKSQLHTVPEADFRGVKVTSSHGQRHNHSMANEPKPKGRKRLNTLKIEDIPRQIVPRGIAARSYGMEEFLSALKIGIVVRRHRPKAKSSFVKLSSSDGGDTIQISYVSPEDAVIALKEQRLRFNKNFDDSHRSTSSSCSKGWSDTFSTSGSARESEALHSFSVPDYIAAEKYRGTMSKVGISQMLIDATLKAANAGLVKASDIIAVHPATHSDPFSSDGQLGTSTLRDSVSQYTEKNTFSLILPAINLSLPSTKSSLKQISEKWYSASGSEKNFRYLDFEAATEGEYWSIFRGFLLLHRDATYGRFASQRASGFSSKYSKLELEQMRMVFQPEGVERTIQYDEPKEETLLLRILKLFSCVSKTAGEFESKRPAPPPPDYFLGFKSTGTQIWSRLRLAGLETQRIHALDTTKVMIKVRCPPDRLMDVAEVLRFKLKTVDGRFS